MSEPAPSSGGFLSRLGSPSRLGFPRSIVLLTLGAIALRLILLAGRGNYVAFDEGWYLLLGRNLWSGKGYTLSGLQHVTLSPLFPILSGALDRLIGDPVWAGRIVAAVSSGLLVLPCWYVFRRVFGSAAAGVGALFVALMPSLAPFVVPYWIGWDLWVGAEPLLHLFLFAGIALALRGWEDRRWGPALGSGVAFGLAYLARPEAIVAFGILGTLSVLGALLPLRSPRGEASEPRFRAVQIVVGALAFVIVAAPYWVYLHDSLGRWTITGRQVQVIPRLPVRAEAGEPAPRRSGPANRIETMLWRDDESPYIRRLYALNEPGTALASTYWGVALDDGASGGGAPKAVQGSEEGGVSLPADAGRRPEGADTPDSAGGPDEAGDEESAVPGVVRPTPDSSAASSPGGGTPGSDGGLARLRRYARALGIVAPWYLWLFAVPGVIAPGRDRRAGLEAMVAIPLIATSVLIANVVAVDPRTQVFLAPLAALYAGRGALVVADWAKARAGDRVRERMVTRILVGTLALYLFGVSAFRLGMSLGVGSPHHVVAGENATVGAAIREAAPEDATVMSWHPALALFADRDWRVLPLEPMDRIVGYARTQPDPWVVLSVFYPPRIVENEEPHYLVVPIPPDIRSAGGWRIDVTQRRTVYAFGRLVPVD